VEVTRLGAIGAWLVVAIGVVSVAAGLIVSASVGTTLGGPFYFMFYLAVAAPPLIAGTLALRRPAPVTYLIAAVIGGGYGAVCLWGFTFGVIDDQAVRLAVLLLGVAGVAAALLLAVSLSMARGRR
jgi:hypothetical protein